MATTISKEFTFEAAHQLPNHEGKCKKLHGHSYKCEVFVEGDAVTDPEDSEYGMVVDYYKFKDVWNNIEPLLDHNYLNESIGGIIGPTTAENIAKFIFDQFDAALSNSRVEVVSVTVKETASSSATYNI